MKVAIYPGSFNPFHEGHYNVLMKATSSQLFDKIIIAIGENPEKSGCFVKEQIKEKIVECYNNDMPFEWIENVPDFIEIVEFSGLLKDYLKKFEKPQDNVVIIKGLRNAQDLEYETTQQYWNEDLGITIPTFYVITDRNLRHVSSSAIRGLEKFNINYSESDYKGC